MKNADNSGIIQVLPTADGSYTLLRKDLNETYHSKFGAWNESMHVYIEAGFKYLEKLNSINVLEIGFGTGLNAFLTAFNTQKQQQIYYTGLETTPIPPELYPIPQQIKEDAALIQLWQAIQHAQWNTEIVLTPNLYFQKLQQNFENFCALQAYDIIYYDAFAPTVQPEIWKKSILQHAFHCLKNGGVLVTYCAKGEVRRNLQAVGFSVQKLPGPLGKREMLRAIKP